MSAHLSRSLLAGACAALLCAACKPASDSGSEPATASPAQIAAEQPAAPGQDAAGTEAQALAFLKSVYGDAATLAGEWSAHPTDKVFAEKEPASDTPATRKVCARQNVQQDGQAMLLLAVCGQAADFGHPTPGLNDFFLLQTRDGGMQPVARAHMEAFGSMGSAGDVAIERFGAQLYGFLVDSGFTNMGLTTSSHTVVLPKGDTFIEAARFRSGLEYDDPENCQGDGPCDSPKAFDIDFKLDIDASQPDAAVYPLQISESGNACGKPAQGRYTLTLDPATRTYAVPPALEREGCETDTP